MGLYEGIKDVAKVLQRADNVELYIKLLDLGEQALDLQAEISRLRTENEELKRTLKERQDIEHHKTRQVDVMNHEHPYITLKNDSQKIRYCAICWGNDHKLIPLYDDLNCIVCLERRNK